MIVVEKKRSEQKNIIVLVSPWNSPSFVYHFIKKIIPAKYGYIHYTYAKSTLSADPEATKKNFLQLIGKIEQDLNALIKVRPRNFFLYGQSLGGLFCMIVADKIAAKKVMLIVPGSNLAESFWYGNRTKSLKQEMERGGMILKKLKKCWQEISPDNYFADKSRQAKFYVVLSTKDKTIPIDNGRKLVEILKRQRIKSDVTETFLPHIGACVKESLLTKNFSRCLIDKNP